VIYSHGLLDPNLEAATIQIAPAVFFAHTYYGTCISGAKAFKRPRVQPCNRRFGKECLQQYYPRSCGGLNPVTMLQEYHRQSQRLKLLTRYRAIVTHSKHMRAEYLNHGFAPEFVHDLLYYVHQKESPSNPDTGMGQHIQSSRSRLKFGNGDGLSTQTKRDKRSLWRMLFVGRMDLVKGGSVLLEALPLVFDALQVPLYLTFAGDGPARRKWERQARRVERWNDNVHITFTGWIKGAQLEEVLGSSDLLVVPSLLPEPFGLIGPEAGSRGLPVAAFAVGGIPDWLSSGVNGYLAKGDPPTATGLAEAITKCLSDPTLYASLRHGAVSMARRFNIESHLLALLEVLGSIAAQTKPGSA
jgi:glycosyltransferase involved in cell wall biosynthesis